MNTQFMLETNANHSNLAFTIQNCLHLLQLI